MSSSKKTRETANRMHSSASSAARLPLSGGMPQSLELQGACAGLQLLASAGRQMGCPTLSTAKFSRSCHEQDSSRGENRNKKRITELVEERFECARYDG